MSGKFQWKKFNQVNLKDSFFDSLKNDYPEFVDWFKGKSDKGEETLVYEDESGVEAFLYLKNENESIELKNEIIPACPRIKIGTLRLSERVRGIRLGEGALGVALWKWQETMANQIYVTVFEKHQLLIQLFEKFGFNYIGSNTRGERVYLKSRKCIDYSDAFKAFPFITPGFNRAGVIPIHQTYHDQLFPYSELMRNNKNIEEVTAGNGITKVFIATPYTSMHYYDGEPVGIYRISDEVPKTYKSAITSYGVINKIIHVRDRGRNLLSLEEFIKRVGNKTVYSQSELECIFFNAKNKNIVMLEIVYNGFFGKGHNINHKTLNERGLFSTYPYQIDYTKQQFTEIMEMGGKDVHNIIID